MLPDKTQRRRRALCKIEKAITTLNIFLARSAVPIPKKTNNKTIAQGNMCMKTNPFFSIHNITYADDGTENRGAASCTG
jgi:hypothetical protein